MNFKLRPLSAAMLAAVTVLAGCSSEDDDKVEKTALTQPGQVNPVTGFVETAVSGLSCKSPDIVQVIDSDFYPLTSAEIAALQAAAKAFEGVEAADEAAWDAAFNAYEYDYEGIDLYAVFASVGAANGHTNDLGLTVEEAARQAVAKAEAKTFKGETQKQAAIFGDGFDAWFDTWFATVPLTDYLGDSQRLDRARRGYELSLTASNDDQEVCYTPPASCPNFQIVDETGTFSCVTPAVNPLMADQPNNGVTETTVAAGSARVYYKAANHGEADAYKDLIIHAWNDPDCTAYTEESTTGWSQGPAATAIDPEYGAYWELDLLDDHDQCGNIIIFNKVEGDQGKKISSSDLRLPLGNDGSLYVNLDKQSYFQDGVNAINYDGFLFANQHPLVGASSGSKSCGWGTELNEAGDACVGQVIDSCPAGTIAVGVYVDATDTSGDRQVDVASKCVEVFDPTEAELFVRGAYHTADWSADDANKMVYGSDGKFYLNYSYGDHGSDAAVNDDGTVSHGFKVADVDWTEKTNFGGITGGDQPSVDGAAVNLTVGEGVAQNLTTAFTANKIYQFVLDANTAEATTMEINEVPSTAIPHIKLDDADSVIMPYSGSGKYFYQQQLAADTYSITISDAFSDFVLGASQGNETIVLDADTALADVTTALTLTIAEAAVYDFVLDLSDSAAPTLKVEKAAPLGLEPVYLRGSMNGWGNPSPLAVDEMAYDKASRTYSLVVGLENGSPHNFKIADAAWGAVNLGGSEVTYSTEGQTLSGTGDINVVIDKSTTYQFSLDFSASSTGELKVVEAPIYIRGGIYGTGDWATDETMRLHFQPTDDSNSAEGGHIFSSEIVTTGAGNFKIADAGWGDSFGYNYGLSQAQVDAGQNQIVLGEPMQLHAGGDSKDIGFINHEAGTYIFSFNNATKELTVTKK